MLVSLTPAMLPKQQLKSNSGEFGAGLNTLPKRKLSILRQLNCN